MSLRVQKTLTENDVEKQTKDYMGYCGFRAFRMQVGRFKTPDGRWVTVGERGLADWLFVHPDKGAVFVECKRPRAKPKPHQVVWIREMRAQGFIVWVVDGLDSLESQHQTQFG